MPKQRTVVPAQVTSEELAEHRATQIAEQQALAATVFPTPPESPPPPPPPDGEAASGEAASSEGSS